MTINVRKVGKINIVDMSGKMTIGKGDVLLRKSFRELLQAGERLFIFNMENVPWLDSAATGEVVACHKRAREVDGIIKIVMPTKAKTHEVFVLASLDRVFSIFEDEKEALASFVA